MCLYGQNDTKLGVHLGAKPQHFFNISSFIGPVSAGVNKDFTEKQPLGVVHPQRMEGQQSVVLQMT